MKSYTVAVVGATGLVGRKMSQVLEEHRFPVGELRLLASARSAGKTVAFARKQVPVLELTAGSFAGIITGWFAWILRPQRHAHLPEGNFPAHADFTEHTPETVLEKVVEPAGSLVMRVSTAVRRLQHGRVQAYILYLVIGLVALAILAVMKGTK